MTQRGPFLFLVALLLLVGLGIASFRHQEFRIPWLPGAQQMVWEVQARVEFVALGEPTQAYLTLPPNQDGFRLIRRTPASTFGYSVDQQGSQERAHWAKRRAEGEQVLFYKLQLVKDDGYRVDIVPPGPQPTVAWDEPYKTAVQQIIQSALPISADARTPHQSVITAMDAASRAGLFNITFATAGAAEQGP